MEITQLEATKRLAGAGVHRPSAIRLLQAGFAGPARAVGGAVRPARLLYDEGAVDRLVASPLLLTFPCTTPTAPAALVIRSHARRPDAASACGWSGIDLSAAPEEQLEAVRRTRTMGLGAWAQAVHARRRDGVLRVVVTMDSFVALGADAVALDLRGGHTVLELTTPGPWFVPLASARLWSGLGADRRWLMLDPRLALTG